MFLFFLGLGFIFATDTYDKILAAADRNNEVSVSVSENVPRAPFQQITMPMNTPTKLHPVEYASLNEKITKVGYLRQSFWPTGILRNIKAVENLASQLFPFDGDLRFVLLFIAFKLHHLGPLGKLLRQTTEAIDLVCESRARSIRNLNDNVTLAKYLQEGLPTELRGTPFSKSKAYNSFLKSHSARLEISKALACTVISDCNSDDDIVANRALCVLTHNNMQKLFEIMSTDFGYNFFNNSKHAIDTEHGLAAKCILNESWHVFSKMKRAVSVATSNCLNWPSDTDFWKMVVVETL